MVVDTSSADRPGALRRSVRQQPLTLYLGTWFTIRVCAAPKLPPRQVSTFKPSATTSGVGSCPNLSAWTRGIDPTTLTLCASCTSSSVPSIWGSAWKRSIRCSTLRMAVRTTATRRDSWHRRRSGSSKERLPVSVPCSNHSSGSSRRAHSHGLGVIARCSTP